MYVTDKAEIVIDASPEEIWEYVTESVHWTASNSEEHYGLEYDTPDNRPREGANSIRRKRSLGCTPTLTADSSILIWLGRTMRHFMPSTLSIEVPTRLVGEDVGTNCSKFWSKTGRLS